MTDDPSAINRTDVKLDVSPAHPRVDATFTAPKEIPAKAVVFVFGHGIMNDKDHALVARPLERLAQKGFCGLRFNFPFKQKGSDTVDRRPVLMDTLTAAIHWVRDRLEGHDPQILVGGKSLSARMAAAHQAEHGEAHGLVYLGYPLHRPDATERLRDRDLKEIQAPQLFFSGEQDPYCRPGLLRKVINEISSPKELVLIPDGDHGLGVSETADDEKSRQVLDQVVDETGKWVRAHFI